MLPLKWLLVVAVLFLPLTIVLIRRLILGVRSASVLARVNETSAQYRREMYYLESLVFHVAFKEGSVSPARIRELVPGLAECPSCCTHLRLVFEFGSMRRDLIHDSETGSWRIPWPVKRKVALAEIFQDLGQDWVLPASKITFEHRACHAEYSS